MKNPPFSFRIDAAQTKHLRDISRNTKIPVSTLLRQAIDQTLIDYSLYISDRKLREKLLISNLNLVHGNS